MRLIKGVCALSLMAFLTMTAARYQSYAVAHGLFGNMTYFTDSPYLIEQITLRDGRYEGRFGRLFYGCYFEGRYIYGDWNQDGRQDAAAIISQSQNGSAENLTLAFLIHDGTKLVHQQSAGLGDRAVIRSIKERDGQVVVDMFVHQPGDCMAGPTKHVIYRYAYSGHGLWVKETLVKVLPSGKLRAL